MSQHTPGPWRYNGRSHAVYAPYLGSGEEAVTEFSVANCTVKATSPLVAATERVANCCLIAAAPDLLEVCTKLLAIVEQLPLDSPLISDGHSAAKRARCVIAKLGEHLL